MTQQDDVNFLLTNFMPRRTVTRFMGWFSKLENPLVARASIAIWRWFSELDLSEAESADFRSMHDCFTRRLRAGARPVTMDPDILVSPCDGLVGACGDVVDGQMLQVKGLPYALADLLNASTPPARLCYVTLRLTSSMYHRFHAPHDLRVDSVTPIFGDAWNVNPITLRRVERVFCRNERAVIRTTLSEGGYPLTLVPVAAILVAGIRLRFLDMRPIRGVRETIGCAATLRKGEEMGWFEHGSTIIVLAPEGFSLCEGVGEGGRIRVGEPLMRLPKK